MVRGDVHEYQALDPSGREQSGSITDSSRSGRRVGRLSVDELWSINDAIKDVFGLM